MDKEKETDSKKPNTYTEANSGIPEVKEGHLKLRDSLKLSMRSFRVRPTRTLLTILGMSVGIGTVFFLISLGYGLQYILLGKIAPTEDSLISLETYYPSERGISITNATLSEVSSLKNVREVSPMAELTGDMRTNEVNGSVIVKAIAPSYFRLSGIQTDFGSPFEDDEYAVVISNTALKLLNWGENESSIGKKFTLSVYDENLNINTASTSPDTPFAGPIEYVKPREFAIKGIVVDDTQPPFIYFPLPLLERPAQSYMRFFAKASDAGQVEVLRENLISEGFLISARIDVINQARKITTAITIVLGVFGIAALVVSAIGMFNTMLISFMERIFEVGIMKSIGATQQDIRNLFLVESLVMGLLGGLGGIFLGVLTSQIFNFGLNVLAKYLNGKPIHLFIYPMQFVVLIIVLSGFVGILSGFVPARRAAKLSAREAFLRK